MPLKATGERVIEEYYLDSPANYLIYLFHKVSYKFAHRYVADKDVLDYGCGSGYGTHQLAPYCKKIIGVDIASEAIDYAREHYQAPNLAYAHIPPAELAPLPYPDASFDTVISFQVIEHIADPTPYLSEIRRVLKADGIFICATPDRSTRLLPGQRPWNMWHVREYDGDGLQALLKNFFHEVTLLRMGGRPEVLALEVRRTRRLAWLTLPITLPVIPETIRVAALRMLKRLFNKPPAKNPAPPRHFPFGESDLVIASDVAPSVNLIVIARRS